MSRPNVQPTKDGVPLQVFCETGILNRDSEMSFAFGDSDVEQVEMSIGNFDQMFVSTGLNTLGLSTEEGANESITKLDSSQDRINLSSTQIGAGINRLSSSIANLPDIQIATQGALSRIGDADITKEVSSLAANMLKRDASITLLKKNHSQERLIIKLLESS